jgi:hypothetical protein
MKSESKKIKILKKRKWSKTIELERINENVAIAKQNLDTIKAGVQKNTEELERLNGQKFQVQAIIASLNTSAGYQQIHRIAESSARNVLNQNQVVLTAACRAIFQALKEEPRDEVQSIIYGSLSYPFYEPGNGRNPQNYLQLRQAILLEAAEETYRNLLARVVNTTTSSALYAQSGSGYPLNWNDNRYGQ